jgi:signal transduction histidine kinase
MAVWSTDVEVRAFTAGEAPCRDQCTSQLEVRIEDLGEEPDVAPIGAEAPAHERWARPSRTLVCALGLAGAAAAAASLALAVQSDHLVQPVLHAVLIDWIILPFVIAGLVAWRLRPDSRFGPLMVAAGFMTSASTLQWANTALPYTLGQLVDLLVAALVVHVFLAYPSGLLHRRPERFVVLTTYLAAVGLQLVKLLLGSDPTNLLTLTPRPTIAGAVERIQLIVISVLCLTALALLAARRWHAGPMLRRPADLLVDAFGIGLLMLAVLFVAAAFQWPTVQSVRLVTFAVLGVAPIAFLYGLVDARLARARVGGLLVELRAHPTSDLQQPLARALRDPSLTLAYWLPDFGTWADQEGRPVPPPEQMVGRGTALIHREGEPVAALLFDPALDAERPLVDAVTAAAAIALENDRLHVELKARVQELQESRTRMLEAGATERQRLERNLHDGAQQRLVALSLDLGLLEGSLRGDAESSGRLRRARQEIATSLEELRDVARGIYPAVLSDHGLEVALDSLAVRAPVPLRLRVTLDRRLPAPVEAAAYYLVSEGLTNIGKHAHAGSALVEVHRANGVLVVEVTDDGVGGADTERGTGLRGLADRVESLGGQLRVWTPLGSGTRMRAEIPCG